MTAFELLFLNVPALIFDLCSQSVTKLTIVSVFNAMRNMECRKTLKLNAVNIIINVDVTVLRFSNVSRIKQKVITARIPKGWGRYCFHRCLSIHISGVGYPLPSWWGYPILPNGGCTPSFKMGGYPHPRSGQGWTPSKVRTGGTSPSSLGPRSRWGGGWGVPLTGTAQHLLATRWAVCLLRSRRRTFF